MDNQLLALRAFVRIADAGSFGKAADLLQLPRSTVSKLISQLERHLNTTLIQRTTRKVTVTPEGALYYERAQKLIADLEDMDDAASRTGAQPAGRLRVDIGSVMANLILIPALPRFLARYPEIDLQLGVSDRPADLLGEGIDCVIRGGALADTSMVARTLCELDFVTCAHVNYLKRYGAPAHPQEIAGKHRVLGYFSSLTGKPFPLHFQRGDEVLDVAPKAVVAINESTAHVCGLLAGVGLGQTFRYAVQAGLDSGELKALLTDWTPPRRPLHIMYPSSRHLNAKVRVFVDWAVELFAPYDNRPGTFR